MTLLRHKRSPGPWGTIGWMWCCVIICASEHPVQARREQGGSLRSLMAPKNPRKGSNMPRLAYQSCLFVCCSGGREAPPPSCQLSPFLLSRFSSLLASSPLITVGATRLLAGSGCPPLGEDLQRRHSDRTNWRKDLSREGGTCHTDVPKRLDYRPDHPSGLCSSV